MKAVSSSGCKLKSLFAAQWKGCFFVCLFLTTCSGSGVCISAEGLQRVSCRVVSPISDSYGSTSFQSDYHVILLTGGMHNGL